MSTGGILEQIKKCHYYAETLTIEMLEDTIKECFRSPEKFREYIWYAINTVNYSGRNLAEVRRHHLNAENNARIIKSIQGYKPKVKFKYDTRRIF